MPQLAAQLAEQARLRFAKWDAELWDELVAGPASTLAKGLRQARQPEDEAQQLVESYLRLACEGIGLGYLFRESSDARSFLTLAFYHLLPEGLPGLPPESRASTLAECWNLGENLERAPLWLGRIFVRLVGAGQSLANLESLARDVERRALEAPSVPLGQAYELRWVHLAVEDRRFLPGALHFAAPTVVCVHDRHRGTPQAGRAAATLGVWLDQEPLTLGPLHCQDVPPKDPGLDLKLLESVSQRDPRAGDWHAMARNEWRAALSLETSQFLVALLPA